MKIKMYLLVCLLGLSATLAFGQTEFKPTIKPYLNVQLWNVYSFNYTQEGQQLGNRYSPYFRRGRAGLTGNLLPEISYNAQFYFDYLGKEEFASSKGTPNPGTISVWTIFFTWKVFSDSELLNITSGSFLPHVSREAATSFWSVTSLDKAETSCYIRQFISGKTNGVCPGINIGGLAKINSKAMVNYNVAIINRQDKPSMMNDYWSPVFLGKLMLSLGSPEWKSYRFTHRNDFYQNKKMVTFNLAASNQGRTDAFLQSSTYGGDMLVHIGIVQFLGSYYKLYRKNETTYRATCSTIKGSANFALKHGWILQPNFMFDFFEGEDNYTDASFFDGTDKILDSGLNAISSSGNLKIGLHYIAHSGGGTKNHFVKSGLKTGDYCCLAIQMKI